MYSSGSGYRPVARCCEHDNELLDCVKGRIVGAYLRHC